MLSDFLIVSNKFTYIFIYILDRIEAQHNYLGRGMRQNIFVLINSNI